MLQVIHAMVSKVVRTTATRKLAVSLATAAGLSGALVPNTASAHDRDEIRIGVGVRSGPECRRWVEPVYEERQVKVWVDATYRTVCDDVLVKPVYRTVCDRRWVEPVYRTQCSRVLVPEVREIREVVRFDCGRRICTRESVVVVPAHYENREMRVCAADGHWENVERQECVTQAHYERVERQELVTPAHYEIRTQRVAVTAGRWETYASAGWDLRIRN